MSVTLPLRLCMGVTMGPALTEAATQAIKLPETTPASSDPVSTGKQTDDPTKKENQTVIQSKNSTKCLKSSGIDASPVSCISGNSLRAVDKQSSTFPKLQGVVNTISVPKQIKNIVIQKGVLLQNLGTTNISATSLLPGKVSGKAGIMNRPSTAVDKDSAKHGGHAVKNRSHTHGEIRGSGKASTASQLRCGSHLYVQRSAGNLYSGTSQARPPSQIASNVNDRGNMNYRLVKCTNASRAPDTKEPTSDGHEVDRTVTEQCDEASKKQAQLERRLEFLQRRARRAEARQVEQHIRQELSSFASHQRQNLQTVSKSVNKSGLGCQSGGDDLNKELLSDGARHMSTAALVSLVHKMQKQGAASQLPVMVKPEVTTILNMSNDERKDSIEAASKMMMNLNMMQSALDSDATESSSGGETDGEDGQDAHYPLPATPLLRRAEWKWASERASIASRWTWLQAQVSDLEYRIRQQTELYRQSRSSKGPVVLAEPPLPQSLTVPAIQTSASSHDGRTSMLSSVVSQGSRQMLPSGDMQSNPSSQSANKCSATVTGGGSLSSSASSHSTAGGRSHETTCNRVTSLPPNAHREDGSSVDLSTSSPNPSMDLDPAVDPTCRAARCFPLKHPLRKRKLVRTSALEMKSAKVAKLSTVKCQCHPTMTPCVLCCRKERSLQKVDPHYMSFQERVSLMDSSFHPVLSFREEVPLSVHFEGLLRSGEWQNKAPVRRPRAEQGQRAQKHKLPILSEGRKALLRKSQSSVIIQSAKIRNKYEQKAGRKLSTSQGLAALGNRTLSTDHKGLTHASFGVGRGRGRRRRGQGTRGRGYMRRGLNVPLSHEAGFLKEKEVRRRRGESAYDINSIVIPRSMAALTRVEKLEYKEIPIPSWRHTKETEAEEDAVKTSVPDPKSNGLIAKETSGNEEMEDLSDESYIQRHIICEMAEKKRFSSAIRLPHGRRRVRAVAQPRVSTASLPDATQSSFPGTPPAMATQISMDSEDFGMDESDSRFSELWGSSRPQSPATVGSTPPGGIPGRAAKDSSASSRQGCAPPPQEQESMTHNPDCPEQSQTAFWPLRQFPLTDEEVSQLEKEDQRIHEEKALPPQPSAVPRIPNLRPQPVETGSQAGSSVCSSLPPSPLPSTSSASVGEDWDTADTEWTLDTDMVKKKGGRTKATKR